MFVLNTYFKFMHFVVIHFVPNKSGATINIQTSPTAVIPMTSSASSRKLQSRSLINIHRSNQARWGATLFVYPCYLPRPGGLSGGRRGALVPPDFLKHVCNFTIVSIQMRMSRSSQSFPSPDFRVPIPILRLYRSEFRVRFRVRDPAWRRSDSDSETDSESLTESLGISSPILLFSL